MRHIRVYERVDKFNGSRKSNDDGDDDDKG